jgi:hypothetical protein
MGRFETGKRMVSNRHLVSHCSKGLVAACLVLVSIVAVAGQQLTQVQYRLSGISLTVTPPTLTVPRGVSTQLNTTVTGAQTLPPGAAVHATLRGPSFPASIEIRTAPNQPIFLPPLTREGTHFLENIRLDIDPTTSIKASPAVVNIKVLDQLLVGAVTSRPLSLAEIQQRGIVFDENSFQALMFTVAFTTASGVRNIEVPVLVPIGGTPQQNMLVGAEIPQLNLQELPGLELPNLGLEALMLEPIEEAPPGVQIPAIPGILVIPGNIAFLNQFFSVFLTVSNRAPNGTPLVVRNVRAQISLPPGGDGVMGNLQRDPPFAPGEPEYDNPLRVARTADGREILKPVLSAGPDGVSSTGDDVNVLVPQASGSTEFLVEGIREGGHVIDIEIRGTLEGLPSGPIEVAGHVRGAVVVRDPNFSLTFIHPDVVRAGTQYDLTVQIRNTSLVDANLVTVSLDPRNMTGARLANPAHASQTIPTIRAGDSATVTLRLEALRTGRVTASTLELAGEAGVVSGRRLSLKTGVSEQGVPLSSDTLILPPDVALLRERASNDDLTARVMALLGEAHSIATAPRASLPLGVLPIPSSIVVQRAGELTSAARRLRLSYRAGSEGDAEPLPDALLLTLQDMYFDFLGARARDNGWDALYRSSRQARLFGAALAEVVGREAGPLGLTDAIALQRHWADTESYRADHITIATSGAGGQVPVTLEVTDRLGRRLAGSLDAETGRREIPGADVLTFESADVPTGQFAVLVRTDSAPYTATLVAQRAGSVELGMVVPDISGQLRHVVFRAVAVNAGERLTLTIRPRSEPPIIFDRSGVPVPATSQEPIVDGPPEVLGIVQMADISIDRFGRVVGVLFDEDVAKATAENPTSYVPGAASIPMIRPPALIDSNIVKGALVQFGGRIVLMGLRDPVGPFVDRSIDISGVRGLKNQTMAPSIGARILPDPDIGNGGQVTGRVLRADGGPVPGAEITYLQPVEDPFGFITLHVVTIKHADAEGRYGLDFVLQNPLGGFVIRARDVATGERGELTAQARANGERLSLDVVLVGRGSIEGVVRLQDGTPLPNAAVRVISGTDFSTYTGGTDQNGFYRISGVTVGPVAVEVTTVSSSARAAGAISGSGTSSRIDVTVFGSANGVVTGIVRLPDGSAAAGIPVTLASQGAVAGDPIPQVAFLDIRTTDAAGAFRFDRIPSAGYLVRAIDKARGFIGDARITVTAANGPENPVAVVVLLAGTGSVSGQVLERVGASILPVAGALVAGGTEIVTAAADGRYTIPAVPVGTRVIEAANPRTGARASREVTILTAGQVSTGIDIVLEPLARVTGRVISPEGQPVPGQEVRLIAGETSSPLGGRTFLVRKTHTGADGTYFFDQLEPREYPLAAVRGNEVANGRARLSSLVTEDVVDLQLIRPTGRVSGRVVDQTNLAVAARVSLKARVPNAAGLLELANAGTTTSDPDRGFTFAALFPGSFTATATSFFSPDSAATSGTLTEITPVADNVVLVLSNNTGRLSGCVLTPEGSTIQPVLDGSGVPLPLPVFITSALLRGELERDPLNTEPDGIRVDASGGCFMSSIPLPPDFYTIEVTDTRTGSPTFGLTAQAFASVERANETTQNVRLLGLGSIVVEVVDALGHALPGVDVTVRRTTYPNDVREASLTVATSIAPLVVEDLTEGPVDVSATVSLDPAVNVGGRDELRGFGGRTTGIVVRDQQRILRLLIDSAGVVSGRFLRVDGSTPVNRAQVQLMSTGRPTAFTLTDATGGFRFNGVAVGAFRLDGFDPSTGRRAHTEGHLTQDGQHVIQDLRLGPIGSVRGVVLDTTRTVPTPGAEVRLTIPNDEAGPRRATAAADGTFLFPSVPGGTATITAVSLEGLSGRTEATLSTEGEVIDVQVLLEGSGRVEGFVRDANGSLVAGAQVSVLDSFGTTRVVQAGTSGDVLGAFALDVVPIGAFTVQARPPGALTPGDGGRATGEIAANGQIAAVDVTFQGTVTVGVVVTGSVGAAPVDVSLQSGGLFGGRATPTGQQDGVFMFGGIPRAPMTMSAKQTTPTGTTISASVTLGQGDLPPPGGRVVPDVQLMLTQVATVQGFVMAESGEPVSGARISLVAGNASTLALAQSDGSFEFLGVPLNVALRIDADGLNRGRAVFIGSIDEAGGVHDRNGNTFAVVTLSLDATPPRIVAVSPDSGATAVPTNSVVTITFSEPIDPPTITSCTPSMIVPTIRLLESSGTPPAINNAANPCDDSNVVPVIVRVATDGRTVTLQPTRSLVGAMPHTVSVSRGAADNEDNWTGGVLDLVGLPLEADFTWNFVTRDDVPPTVLTMSPPTGAVNIPGESVVRVSFSEPIAPSSVNDASIAVAGPAGPITGVRELILGSTVAVFTPTDGSGNRAQLQSNATYSVTVSGLVDLAGNVQRPQDIATATFATRDAIAPTISSISAPAGARHDESVTLIATTADTDVASVEFFLDGVLASASAQPVSLGTYQASLLMPARGIHVSARAVDTSGNVGALSAPAAVTLLPDSPPLVTIIAPAPGTTVVAGETVRFVVHATDDLGIVEIRGAASGAATETAIRTVSPAAMSTTGFFDVTLPVTSPAAPLTFVAESRDGKGQTSATAAVTLTVLRAVRVPVFIDTFDAENNGVGALNFSDFTNWTVMDGSVDLIGNGFFDSQPGNGLYVDLDGTTLNGGRLSMRTPLVLDPGVYELAFDLAGGPDNAVLVEFGGLINETLTLPSAVPFTRIIRGLVLNTRIAAPLSFTDPGNDNGGLYLNDVMVSRFVQTPTILANTPASGGQGHTLDVVVAGALTHFVQGTTVADFGAGITVNGATVLNATTATVNISIAPDTATGLRDIKLTTGEETVIRADGFTVLPSGAIIIEPDADGDSFPDVVEIEVGSNSLDPASTPITVQPPVLEAVSAPFSLLNITNLGDAIDPALFVGQAVGAPFSLLNTSNLAGATDPALFLGEAVSAPFSLLNTSNLTGATDPVLFVGEAASASFSVLNTSNLAGTTDPALIVGHATSAPFAVLNNTNLSGTTDPVLFIGEVVSPFFVVDNNIPPQAPAALTPASAQTTSGQREQTAADLPRVTITAPADRATVFHGQTLDVVVDAAVNGSGVSELLVNGSVLAQDASAPYRFTVTVPASISELTLEASIRDAQGTLTMSSPVRLLVVPDPHTTVIGRLVDADGRPVANENVRVAVSGLRAEFFDSAAPLSALPDLRGQAPTRTGLVSAINARMTGGVFGIDPYGLGMDPDYAARFTGYITIETSGEYTFQLGVDDGARLVVGGETVVQMPSGTSVFQTRSGSIPLAAGLVPIEITYYQSLGDAELQLLYEPPGEALQVVPPKRLQVTPDELQVRTNDLGQFAISNVPANVPAIRLSGDSGYLSGPVTPAAGGVVDVGDVVVQRR